MNETDFDYKRFFDLSPDLLCIAGYDGYFKKINPAVSKLLGYSEEELYSTPIDDFVHPDDQKLTSDTRENMKKSNPLFYHENRYLKNDGEYIWLAWTAMPIENEKLIFAVAKEITHKKILEKERQKLLEDFTEVNQQLKQLALTTSHDLRSPISSIIMSFDLLDTSKILDQQTKDLLNIIKTTGENFTLTLNNYLNVLSDKHGIQSTIEEIDIEQCLNEMLPPIRFLIERNKTTIHTNFSEFSTIRFDKTKLESIFLNLISNSIKYRRVDHPPKISIHTEVRNGEKCLIISDNGMGLDLDKIKDKIFKLHQTFHNHPDSKGVGLYLVHNHVTGMGGKIEVKSCVNEGTTFIITFSNSV
ncbi:MAG: PAS domain-containing sensor histidine kinase [Candidatus Paceibacterota bacterium]